MKRAVAAIVNLSTCPLVIAQLPDGNVVIQVGEQVSTEEIARVLRDLLVKLEEDP